MSTEAVHPWLIVSQHAQATSLSAEALTELVRELRTLARRTLFNPSATFSESDLLQETLIKLAHQRNPIRNRAQFFSLAARTMRRLVLDYQAAKATEKRGGQCIKVPWEELQFETTSAPDFAAWSADHESLLERLEREDAESARVLELRVFFGLTGDEIASALDMSTATVTRRWRFARAFLARALDADVWTKVSAHE